MEKLDKIRRKAIEKYAAKDKQNIEINFSTLKNYAKCCKNK